MTYNDRWLSLDVSMDNNLRKTQCKWETIKYYYPYQRQRQWQWQWQCINILYTAAEKNELKHKIVTTLRSQFQRIDKYILKPLNLHYKKKFPLTVDVRRGNYCNPGTAAYFQGHTNPPKIRLCTENIESDVRHEATHWFMWALNGDVPTYKMMSEGCANYFDDGVCKREHLSYAYSIGDNIPKLGSLLQPGYQTHPIYSSYVMGRLVCAYFHQFATDTHFKQLLETNRHYNDGNTIEEYYQAGFENFVRDLASNSVHFCKNNPDGIYPRGKNLTSTATTLPSTQTTLSTTAIPPTSTTKESSPTITTTKNPLIIPIPPNNYNIDLHPELKYAIETRNIGFFSGALVLGFSFDKEQGVIRDQKLVILVNCLIENGCNLDLMSYFMNHGGEKIIDAQLNATTQKTVRELLLSDCAENSNEIKKLLKLFEYIPGTKRNLLGYDPFVQEDNKDLNIHETQLSKGSTISNSQNNKKFTLIEQRALQGVVGVFNGFTNFVLEKITDKLKGNYPQRKTCIDRTMYFFTQPLLSSSINLLQIPFLEFDNLTSTQIIQNSAINFGLSFVSGVAIQFAITGIQFGVKHCTEKDISKMLIRTVFFLHTMAMAFNSENPNEAAIGQLISSVAAMLTYFLTSFIANQYAIKQVHKRSENLEAQQNFINSPTYKNKPGFFKDGKPSSPSSGNQPLFMMRS